MKKRIVCLLLTLIMVVASVSSLASCMGTTTQTPTVCSHTDTNHDGVCDKNCGQAIAAYTHKAEDDANHDGKCDVCNASGIKVTHVDANHDGKCDKCVVEGLAVNHTDANCDGKCDKCQSKVQINHTDADDNCACDKCGKTTHTDVDENGECDKCGDATNNNTLPWVPLG